MCIRDRYRRGLEVEGSYELSKKLNISGNLTISENKVDTFSQFIDNWDTWGQSQVKHENTDLAFSPKLTWAAQARYKFSDDISLLFNSKYVGEQFIDNTSSDERKLDDYLISNLQIDYAFKSFLFKNAKISFLINNLFDVEYVSNAWVYRYISNSYDPRSSDAYTTLASDGIYDMAGYFPQAKRNYLLGITLEF